MSHNKPGFLSNLAAFLGIVGYLIADFMMVVFLSAFFEDVDSTGDPFADTITTIVELIIELVILAIGIFILAGGMFFLLLGSIWKQSKGIATISLLAFLAFVLPFGYITFLFIPNITDTNGWITLGVIWVVFLGMLYLHIKGFRS